MTSEADLAPRLRRAVPPDRCREYERLAESIVQSVASNYTTFIRSRNLLANTKQWKLIKRRENLKIYRARSISQVSLTQDLQENQQPQWTARSSVLCVGSLVGSIEDAMYGSITPTALSMATRSLLTQDEFTHHAVLQDITLPTVEEPFLYCGLKWARRSSKAASVVKARDLVYVEASGFLDIPTDSGTESVGYTVCHSVEIPELDPAFVRRTIRGRMSLCSIFRQKTVDHVEVFAVLASDPGGSLTARLSAKSAANALIAGANVMECALNRKLAWLRGKRRASVGDSPVAVATVKGSGWCCVHCSRSISSLNALNACDICHSTVCGRCITERKLAIGTSPRELRLSPTHVCLKCLSQALTKVDCRILATEEFAQRGRRSPTRNGTAVYPASNSLKQSVSDSETPFVKANTPKLILIDSVSPDEAVPDYRVRDSPPHHNPFDMDSSDSEKNLIGESSEWEDDDEDDGEEEDVVELVSPVPVRGDSGETLLLQMAALQVKAEQTYQFTTDQTLSLQRSKLSSHWGRDRSSVRIQPLH